MTGDPTPAQGVALLHLARTAIAERLRLPPPDGPQPPDEHDSGQDPAWLTAPGASFVTLTIEHRLRGCIGSLTATRPLGQDVRANAVAAAFRDRRFEPLTPAEYPRIRIEVSVLGAIEPLPAGSRSDTLARLRPQRDGVILTAGDRRATFLPQVWHTLPDPDRFVGQLLVKAGLRDDYWGDDVRVSRYPVTAFAEP